MFAALKRADEVPARATVPVVCALRHIFPFLFRSGFRFILFPVGPCGPTKCLPHKVWRLRHWCEIEKKELFIHHISCNNPPGLQYIDFFYLL